MKNKYCIVNINCPNEEIADKIANSLVTNKLASCVQIVQTWKSIYLWEWKIEKENEILIIVKTKLDLFDKIKKKVLENHPYDVPEIIALPIIEGNKEYLDWIDESLK